MKWYRFLPVVAIASMLFVGYSQTEGITRDAASIEDLKLVEEQTDLHPNADSKFGYNRDRIVLESAQTVNSLFDVRYIAERKDHSQMKEHADSITKVYKKLIDKTKDKASRSKLKELWQDADHQFDELYKTNDEKSKRWKSLIQHAMDQAHVSHLLVKKCILKKSACDHRKNDDHDDADDKDDADDSDDHDDHDDADDHDDKDDADDSDDHDDHDDADDSDDHDDKDDADDADDHDDNDDSNYRGRHYRGNYVGNHNRGGQRGDSHVGDRRGRAGNDFKKTVNVRGNRTGDRGRRGDSHTGSRRGRTGGDFKKTGSHQGGGQRGGDFKKTGSHQGGGQAGSKFKKVVNVSGYRGGLDLEPAALPQPKVELGN